MVTFRQLELEATRLGVALLLIILSQVMAGDGRDLAPEHE